MIKLETESVQDFKFTVANSKNEKLVIRYDKKTNQYYIDRTQSGIVSFNKDFPAIATAPRLSAAKNLKLTLVMDRASVELFADDGATVMTAIFFPQADFNQIFLSSDDHLEVRSIKCSQLNSIW